MADAHPRQSKRELGIDLLLKAMEQAARIPKPALSYIVLDHSWSPSLPIVRGQDAQGRNYALCSPAMLDELRHVKHEEQPKGESILPASFGGVFVYKREDMPEGWPDA